MTGPGKEPTFLIVGAAKAGTTSLAAYLAGHPDVCLAAQKEVHFFDRERRYARGWEWYLERFAAAGNALAVGEATPSYMWMPKAVKRIAHHLPHAQLIAILRNPVDRAYSHYWHIRAFKAESRSFEESLDDANLEARFGYVSRGRYAEQLKRLHEHFSEEQIHVLLFDDLVAQTGVTLAMVCSWIGVEPVESAAVADVHNARFRLRSTRLLRIMVRTGVGQRWPTMAGWLTRLNQVQIDTPPMASATRARLIEQFAPANAELAELIGRDLSAWNH